MQMDLGRLRSVALGTAALETTTMRRWLKGGGISAHSQRGYDLIMKLWVRHILSIPVIFLYS